MTLKSMPKISIVIPMYNAERYIDDIVPCLLNQSLKEIEIILVNDGSRDNTLEKQQEYAEKDIRIKVVNQENGGLSEARNAGIRVAQGEYIWFVDADDFVYPEAAETFYREVSGRDFLSCDFSRAVDRAAAMQTPHKDVATKRKSADTLEEMIKKRPFEGWIGTVWRCLYKRKVIKDNNLCFRFSRLSHEDTLFNYEFLSHCSSCARIDYEGYIYMDTPGSLGGRHDRNVTPEWLDVTMGIIDRIIERFKIDSKSNYYSSLHRLYSVDCSAMVTTGYHADSSFSYGKRMARWEYLNTNSYWKVANKYGFLTTLQRVIWYISRYRMFYIFDPCLLLLTRIHDSK